MSHGSARIEGAYVSRLIFRTQSAKIDSDCFAIGQAENIVQQQERVRLLENVCVVSSSLSLFNSSLQQYKLTHTLSLITHAVDRRGLHRQRMKEHIFF